MTIKYYNQLDEGEQMEAIWDHGVTLAYREDEVYKYELLQIDSFYIELRHHKAYDILHGLRTFDATEREFLEPYLDLIKISNEGE